MTRCTAAAAVVLLIALTPADSRAQTASTPADQLYTQGEAAYREGTRDGRERAIRFWSQAAALYRTAGDRGNEASILSDIGFVQGELGRPDSALTYFARALPILRAIGDRAGEAAILSDIGHIHSGMGQADSALTYHSRALAIDRAVGDRSGEATTLNNIGVEYRNLGRADSALAYFNQALPILRAAGNRDVEAVTLSNIGSVHGGMGRPDSALTYYALALPILREVGDRSGEATTLNNIGETHRNLGRPDSALAYYAQALPILRVVGNRSVEAVTLNNIGLVHSGLGRPDSALAYYARALPILRAVGNRPVEAATLSNIGLVHSGLGRPGVALTYFAQALSNLRAVGNRAGEATALSNIGLVYMAVGPPDSALSYFVQALPIMRAVGNRPGEAATLHNIGSVHGNQGRPDSAVAYYAQALPIWRAVGDPSGEAGTLNNIGSEHSNLGRPDSALVYYAAALQMLRAMGDRSREATTLRNIAYRLYRTSPANLPLAVAYYDSAAAALAMVSQHAGGDENRLSFAEHAVLLFQNWSLSWLARAKEVGAAQSASAALAAAERGRAQALLDLMRRNAAEADGSIGARAAATVAGSNLVEEGRRLAGVITRSGSAALSYLVTSDTLLVWFIGASGEIQVFRVSVTEGELAAAVAAMRDALGADAAAVRASLALRDTPAPEPHQRGFGTGREVSSEDAVAAATRLARWLIPAAVLENLAAIEELVIVPHGALNLLPFGALPSAITNEPLGIRYAIRYSPSLSTLSELAQTRQRTAAEAGADALIVGNPAMPRVRSHTGAEVDLDPLPGAEAEARWVASRLGAVPLGGVTATEIEIRRRLPGASLVHLATHGYAYSSEARVRDSYIALAPGGGEDGLLTVGEVLETLPSLSAELVVLSACQTGLGDLKQAEGTVGLQRAFLAKGARSVLVSLWSVSDEATDLLMRSFYRHWLAGETKAEALRRAQEDVRGAPGSRFHHPRYWAAFQLVGAR